MDKQDPRASSWFTSSGTRLFEHLGGQFELERTDVIATPNATHLRFSVIG